MFEYIQGILVETNPNYIIIDINGIGYKILVPLSVMTHLPNINEEVKCFLKPIIKEDSHTLFGFLDKKQRDLFEMIISVSGIGPKTGLALIGHLDSSNFYDAIANANIKLISKVPGIGKKTAERLIVEMKDKLKIFQNISVEGFSLEGKSNHLSDALNALINLGYSHLIAQKAIKKAIETIGEPKDTGSLISEALKII